MNIKKARKAVAYRKIKQSISRIFQDPYERNEVQKMAISIARRAIFDSKSTMMIAPISGTRYIQFKDIFIKIDQRVVVIINGTYTYHVNISDKDTEWLLNKFNIRLESIRKQWETSITNKTTKSLSTILNDLTNKQ